MPEFVWQWTDGLFKVTTSRIEDAEQALRRGVLGCWSSCVVVGDRGVDNLFLGGV